MLALPDEDLLALDPSAAPPLRGVQPRLRPPAASPRRGSTAVCRCEPGYPERLRDLPDPPAVLHVAGSPAALPAGEAVAIVGSRRATPYGLEVSSALGRALTARRRARRLRHGARHRLGRPPRRARSSRRPPPPVAVLAGGAETAVPRAHAPPAPPADRGRRRRLRDAARLRRPPLVLPRPQPHHRRALDAHDRRRGRDPLRLAHHRRPRHRPRPHRRRRPRPGHVAHLRGRQRAPARRRGA